MPARMAFGWRPDTPDPRDMVFRAEEHVEIATLPDEVDLQPKMPKPVLDQLALGSCTANALSKIFQFARMQQNLQDFVPSRLFIYYNERSIEGTVASDAGAELRNGMKVLATKGACPEEDWPYIIQKFRERPPMKAYANAQIHRAIKYMRVQQSETQMEGCLAAGFPAAIGFTCFDYFEGEEVAKTGKVRMPNPQDRVAGGHAVALAGYNRRTRVYKCLNSWNMDWGMDGYFVIPFDYLHSPRLAADFWTLRLGT